MADALDLGSSVAIRVGSSPTSPTIYVSAERRFSFWGRIYGRGAYGTPNYVEAGILAEITRSFHEGSNGNGSIGTTAQEWVPPCSVASIERSQAVLRRT
jgi:hypothetical protein